MTKTSGVFTVEVQGYEIYVGASSNIEVVVRDYLGWVKKNKAPKAIQNVANEYLDAGMTLDQFKQDLSWSLVFETDNKKEMVEQKRLYKATHDLYPDGDLLGTIEELEADNQPQVEEVELTTEERNNLILERLAEGVSVADVAGEFSVSKSTVYNVKNGR